MQRASIRARQNSDVEQRSFVWQPPLPVCVVQRACLCILQCRRSSAVPVNPPRPRDNGEQLRLPPPRPRARLRFQFDPGRSASRRPLLASQRRLAQRDDPGTGDSGLFGLTATCCIPLPTSRQIHATARQPCCESSSRRALVADPGHSLAPNPWADLSTLHAGPRSDAQDDASLFSRDSRCVLPCHLAPSLDVGQAGPPLRAIVGS